MWSIIVKFYSRQFSLFKKNFGYYIYLILFYFFFGNLLIFISIKHLVLKFLFLFCLIIWIVLGLLLLKKLRSGKLWRENSFINLIFMYTQIFFCHLVVSLFVFFLDGPFLMTLLSEKWILFIHYYFLEYNLWLFLVLFFTFLWILKELHKEFYIS